MRLARRQINASQNAAGQGAVGWLQPLHDWPHALLQGLLRESAVVRVVVAGVRGSAPREVGACMLIGRHSQLGTIGGGRLEWEALAAARALLPSPGGREVAGRVRVEQLVLGADRGQCCGGRVQLWLERYTSADIDWLRVARTNAALMVLRTSWRRDRPVEHRLIGRDEGCAEIDAMWQAAEPMAARLTIDAERTTLYERLEQPRPQLWLYGAGHVGQALVRVLAPLPLRVTWLDSRAALVPQELPPSVSARVLDDVVSSVAAAPAGAHFFVMTYSHALDYALCQRILQRGDFASLGLIGSASKAARFRARLARDGIEAARLARLRCPIGVPGIRSKQPAAIAIAIAAEWLQQEATARPEVVLGAGTDCAAGGCAACAQVVP